VARPARAGATPGTYLDLLASRLGPETCLALGNELRPGLPLATLFWFVERGELPPDALPLTLADLVLVQLCGAAPGVEVTNAAATGPLDIVRGAWHTTAPQFGNFQTRPFFDGQALSTLHLGPTCCAPPPPPRIASCAFNSASSAVRKVRWVRMPLHDSKKIALFGVYHPNDPRAHATQQACKVS